MAQERRSYHSPRRAAQALETRERLVAAAREAFAANGWAKTTLKAVAGRAGVAEPTVYAVFGSKAGLAGALLDTVDAEADVPALLADYATSTTPRTDIEAMARFSQRMYERVGDIVGMLHEGAATSEALAAAYRDGLKRGDDGRRRVLDQWPAGALRSDLTREEALDIASLTFSYEVWAHLMRRGWTGEQVRDWCVRMLCNELLADSPAPA